MLTHEENVFVQEIIDKEITRLAQLALSDTDLIDACNQCIKLCNSILGKLRETQIAKVVDLPDFVKA